MKPVIIAPLVALALAAGGAGAYFWLSSGGEVEEAAVTQPSPTPEPSPTATAVPNTTPSATAEPTVTIPADWQTYDDPKGRFSIRVPPDWEMSPYATEDYPQWLQLGETQPLDAEIADGVKLEVAVQSTDGRSLADLAAVPPEEGLYPRLSQDFITINGQEALYLTRGLDLKIPSQVTYVFEHDAEFLAVTIYTGGPRAPEYISLFEDRVIKSFVLQ